MRVGFVCAVLAIAGAVGEQVIAPVRREMRAIEPALRLPADRRFFGSGAVLALLGGNRALVADALWLRLHAGWERRELAATDALVRLVPQVDPRPVYFWINGARILAYDFPAWRIAAAGGFAAVAADEQGRIVREQARSALAFLDGALVYHRGSTDLWIERAAIEFSRLRDFEAAAESYRRAAELPNAPPYAARLHAEMLRRAGKKAEALAWLTRLHPTLPPDDEEAAAELVLARIRELERELGVPGGRTFRLDAQGAKAAVK